MAPLAGKPPFATDEPDSFYDTPQPQQRQRQPKPADPNARTSAYNVYDNYLAEDAANLKPEAPNTSLRNSGIGAMLLNMGDDSEDDSDMDEDSYRRRPAPPGITPPLSKNAALAAATGVTTSPSPSPSPTSPTMSARRTPSPHPPPDAKLPPTPQQQAPQMQQMPSPRSPVTPQARGPSPTPPFPQAQPHQMMPQPIAAPRPGYAAPMAALNNLARPEPAMAAGRKGPVAPIQIPNNSMFTGAPMIASPAPSTPHPLLPPMTPITAAFIRPKASADVVNVSFAGLDGGDGKARPRKPIIRGNSEETLLPSRGEKGDDFWRRFSMVVKEENSKRGPKESSWLKQTMSGSKRHQRSIWLVGILFIILIAAGAGLGVYFTRNSPSHQQPTAIGGSADNGATIVVTTTAAKGAPLSSSSLHVSPTNTVARREAIFTPKAVPSPLVVRHKRLKNREAHSW